MVLYKVELEESELDPGRRGRGRRLGEPRNCGKNLEPWQVAGMMADIIDESWGWWIRGCRDEAPWKSQGFTVNGFGGGSP